MEILSDRLGGGKEKVKRGVREIGRLGKGKGREEEERRRRKRKKEAPDVGLEPTTLRLRV